MKHLMEWVEALGSLLNTSDWPFACLDDVAMQLELWRAEYQEINAGRVASEAVSILTYGDEVILICDQQTGEYIKLSLKNAWSTETSF
jgi:hypothetical protein